MTYGASDYRYKTNFVDSDTDCVAVVQAAMGKGSAIRPHLALLGLRLRAAREHASREGGEVTFRHILRNYNKIADGLCNKAMDNWATLFIPPSLLTSPFPKLTPAVSRLTPAPA